MSFLNMVFTMLLVNLGMNGNLNSDLWHFELPNEFCI